MTCFDQIVEVFGGRWLEGLEAEVIQHQQVWAQVGLKAAFVTAVRASAVELAQQFVGVGEEHVEALVKA